MIFTTDLAGAVRDTPYVFVMFDTPVNDRDESDLTGIFQACEIIAPALARDASILVTAQVPVGTCDALAAIIHAKSPTASATIAYMPENSAPRARPLNGSGLLHCRSSAATTSLRSSVFSPC